MASAVRIPDWPAALTQQEAATYVGLSTTAFVDACPVQPVCLTKTTRGNRYLRERLDEWLRSLDTGTNPTPKPIGMGALFDATSKA